MLTAEQIAVELEKAVERSVESVADQYGTDATGLQWYLRMLEQKWCNGSESLECRFRDICNSPTILQHPLYRAIKHLEEFITKLEQHLPDDIRERHKASFDERVDKWSNAWRQKHGFLSNAAMGELYERYGSDNCLDANGFAWTLTPDEAREVAERNRPRLVARAS